MSTKPMMQVNDYLKNNRDDKHKWLTARLVCEDGFSISVQASNGHYCQPRRDGEKHYYEVELGYPSENPGEAILAYAESAEYPTDTVYAYVPVDLVQNLLDSHGGIKGRFHATEPTP